MQQQHQNTTHTPWYAKKKSQREGFSHEPSRRRGSLPSHKKSSFNQFFCAFFPSLLLFVSLITFGASLTAFISLHVLVAKTLYVLLACAILSLLLSMYLVLYQLGVVCRFFAIHVDDKPTFTLGVSYLKGALEKPEARKGIPAPEMALYQFVQQVRSYAMEKVFLKQKNEKATEASFLSTIGPMDLTAILKRRWNDVSDSLNEFEIYLANDPSSIIERLVDKSPMQNMDVSQIFRDVADTFDNTWRRKGINIEQAIVTPLKANTNEALLRRLLVGPWRSCVYFARRGNGVIFSSKSINGKIVAHWECEGVVFPEEFLLMVRDNELSVNERIEQGMEMIALDPNSPNTLFALISFVIWLDLARAAKVDFNVVQGNEGLIIEMNI